MDSAGDASARDGESEPSSSESAVTSPPPVTNAILSQAVLNAIGQMDTKLAFDMMLLSEQMNTLDGENKCLKDENAFLKDKLAKQTQEQSEMYHYLNGKLDQHVTLIAMLERESAALKLERDAVVLEHSAQLADTETKFGTELARANTEIANLQLELRQLHTFAQQKLALETQMEALEATLAQRTRAFEDEKLALERKSIFEKDRVKNEMLVRLRETKEALLQRTDDHVNTTTKRTMAENEHCMDELSFQSKETEKLLARFQLLEAEVKGLRVKTKMLEETEAVMAKKNYYYQRILHKLQRRDDRAALDAVLKDDSDVLHCSTPSSSAAVSNTDSAVKSSLEHCLAPLDDDATALRSRVDELEAALKHAHDWLRAFQHEKQFIVAQQDEIIQFLCRAVQDAAHALANPSGAAAVTTARQVPSDQHTTRLAKQTTSMDDFAALLPPAVALDELSTEENRFVLLFLLEKMKIYQQRLALLFQSNSNSSSAGGSGGGSGSRTLAGNTSKHREQISKQLGVELPPIHSAAAPMSGSGSVAATAVAGSPMSPLKQHRRMFAHISSVVATAMDGSGGESSSQGGGSGGGSAIDPQAPSRKHHAHQHPQQQPPSPNNGLLAMATNQFNFLSTAAVASKSPMKSHVSASTSSTSTTSVTTMRNASDTSPAKPMYRKLQQAPGHASLFAKKALASGTTGESSSSSELLQSRDLLNAWSNSSVPTLANSGSSAE